MAGGDGGAQDWASFSWDSVTWHGLAFLSNGTSLTCLASCVGAFSGCCRWKRSIHSRYGVDQLPKPGIGPRSIVFPVERGVIFMSISIGVATVSAVSLEHLAMYKVSLSVA